MSVAVEDVLKVHGKQIPGAVAATDNLKIDLVELMLSPTWAMASI